MWQLTKVDHVLEISRHGQVFSWADDRFLREASNLAMQGQHMQALIEAQDAYVKQHGDMHGVSFRVRTTSETITQFSPPTAE